MHLKIRETAPLTYVGMAVWTFEARLRHFRSKFVKVSGGTNFLRKVRMNDVFGDAGTVFYVFLSPSGSKSKNVSHAQISFCTHVLPSSEGTPVSYFWHDSPFLEGTYVHTRKKLKLGSCKRNVRSKNTESWLYLTKGCDQCYLQYLFENVTAVLPLLKSWFWACNAPHMYRFKYFLQSETFGNFLAMRNFSSGICVA